MNMSLHYDFFVFLIALKNGNEMLNVNNVYVWLVFRLSLNYSVSPW